MECHLCKIVHTENSLTYCGAFLTPHLPHEFLPPPLPLEESPEIYHGPLRQQEIRFIETYGLVTFCQDFIESAVLQDADYLRAQLVFLRK